MKEIRRSSTLRAAVLRYATQASPCIASQRFAWPHSDRNASQAILRYAHLRTVDQHSATPGRQGNAACRAAPNREASQAPLRWAPRPCSPHRNAGNDTLHTLSHPASAHYIASRPDAPQAPLRSAPRYNARLRFVTLRRLFAAPLLHVWNRCAPYRTSTQIHRWHYQQERTEQ